MSLLSRYLQGKGNRHSTSTWIVAMGLPARTDISSARRLVLKESISSIRTKFDYVVLAATALWLHLNGETLRQDPFNLIFLLFLTCFCSMVWKNWGGGIPCEKCKKIKEKLVKFCHRRISRVERVLLPGSVWAGHGKTLTAWSVLSIPSSKSIERLWNFSKQNRYCALGWFRWLTLPEIINEIIE